MASVEVFYLINFPHWKMRFYSMDSNVQNMDRAWTMDLYIYLYLYIVPVSGNLDV